MYKRWEPQSSHRSLRHWLKILSRAKTWQLVIILILLSFVSATFLRLNNLGMVKHRDAVETADKKGDIKATKQTLIELQHYVSSHMNTDLGKGIYLKQTYLRDYNAAIEAAADSHNPNSDVYQQAALECRSRFQGGTASFRNDYVTCVANAVANLPSEQQKTVHLPSPGSYHYNFASPLISLDLAGFFVFISILLLSFILLRLIALYSLRFLILRHNKFL